MDQINDRKDLQTMDTHRTTSPRAPLPSQSTPNLVVLDQHGATHLLDQERILRSFTWAARGVSDAVSIDLLIQETFKNIYDGISSKEIAQALVLSASSYIERDPAYDYVACQLMLKRLYKEVTGRSIAAAQYDQLYRTSFVNSIKNALDHGILDPRIAEFDLELLATYLKPERDNLFGYIGIKTLHERYFLKILGRYIEMPQMFWMRVAMGLCLLEEDKNKRVLEFYELMSTLRYVPSTPTLLFSALARPQLSSCFLSTVDDDLKEIFKCYSDNAQLSKWSGGVANDWTNVRATGSMVKSIRTESQGLIPYLKIVNDVTAAINRSGSRRGATVVYIECWHLDYEDFLDLRRNTGDERRRAHDINTASWIPDLFMQRLVNDGMWTMFCPSEVPDLHHIYGRAFQEQYEKYEQLAQEGKIKQWKEIRASDLWRKMLSRLFETGHPWITFKDPSNIRSPQDHVGVVHGSNLCTEITLNTSTDEVAVCNLGSVNLARHIKNGVLDTQLLANTVQSALRALDNVIDINFYPIPQAQHSNLRHRPVGLGLMGLQDALYELDIAFDEPQALEFNDYVMEFISYHAILASSQLARERGAYASYKGSKWDRNIFPYDTIALLEAERGMPVDVDRNFRLDWKPVREHVQQYGMRNSNTMAIAPTATIANIAGCFPCTEPIYKNIYTKTNMSGEFTVINKFLVRDLKALGMWNQDTLDMLKYYDGSLSLIPDIPDRLKNKYKEAFEIDSLWLVKLTATRGKWIDQSQSHNVFMKGVSGKLLNDIYLEGWKKGLKTFYYLRTLGASQIEKSTLDAKKFGFTQKREYTSFTAEASLQGVSPSMPATSGTNEMQIMGAVSCKLSEDPECEVCQ